MRHEAIAADIALDGLDALERVAATPYDIVLLDRDIPGVHGDEVCRQVPTSPPAYACVARPAGCADGCNCGLCPPCTALHCTDVCTTDADTGGRILTCEQF